ncbi:hypothetical protein [Streptomyces sp. NPDC059349]|uniref:hypothetical protein n=1 Tax=Streptomyces sp. NPDC059349 TaxID=3346808 RepID=UPI0036D0F7D6
MPRNDRRATRLKVKRPQAGNARPRFGPWVAGEPGWTICPTHDFGVMPGSTCLRCRLSGQAA